MREANSCSRPGPPDLRLILLEIQLTEATEPNVRARIDPHVFVSPCAGVPVTIRAAADSWVHLGGLARDSWHDALFDTQGLQGDTVAQHLWDRGFDPRKPNALALAVLMCGRVLARLPV